MDGTYFVSEKLKIIILLLYNIFFSIFALKRQKINNDKRKF